LNRLLWCLDCIDNGLYGLPDRCGDTDKIAVQLLGDLVIDLRDIFAI
jgi:hypothetical protein